MNKLFLAFIFAFVHGCGSVGIAQTTPNTQTYFQNLPTPVNLIKNPDARLNALDVQKTGTVVVTATAATGNSPTYFSIGAISTLGYAEFNLRPVKSDMTSGQCEFKGKYFGTEASKYSARIFNGTTEIIKVVLKNTTSDLASGGPWGEFSVGAPCSSNPKVRIYADAVGLSLNVNRLYYDKATNIGTYTPPNEYSVLVGGTNTYDQTPYGANWVNPTVVNSTPGVFVLTLTTPTTTPMRCNATVNNGTFGHSIDVATTNTTITVRTSLSTTSAGVNVSFHLKCNKTGPETAETVVRPETPRTPNIVRYTSGSGTYTPTPGTKYIIVKMVGGGGGGAGGAGSVATNGGNTTFGSIIAGGGSGGATGSTTGVGGGGGINTISGVTVISDAKGSSGGTGGIQVAYALGGYGGVSCLTGGSPGKGPGSSVNVPAGPNSGSGGGGGGATGATVINAGHGGGSGGCLEFNAPVQSYSYSVGAGGAGSASGANGTIGSDGAAGIIIITEHFSNDVNAILAGMEPIGASYHSPTNTTLSDSTVSTVFFGTKIWEYGNNYNPSTGVFTVPSNGSGMYSATCDIALASTSWSAADLRVNAIIRVNGVEVSTKRLYTQASGTYSIEPPTVTVNTPLDAGQTVTCNAFQNSGSNKTLLTGVTYKFTILRIGLK